MPGRRSEAAAEPDFSLVRNFEARDQSEQRRLATAAWTENPNGGALRNIERQRTESGTRAEPLGHIFQRDRKGSHQEPRTRRATSTIAASGRMLSAICTS